MDKISDIGDRIGWTTDIVRMSVVTATPRKQTTRRAHPVAFLDEDQSS